MKFLPEGWRRGFRIWRRAPTQEVDAELQFHLEERVAELIERGMPADQARAEALREFGDVADVRARLVAIDEQSAGRRDFAERWEWVAQDIGYVFRSLRRAPAFVITVTLTLALGLGANAAVFSLLDRLFFQAPPGIANPERIRRIYRIDPVSMSRRYHAEAPPANSVDISTRFSHDDFAALVTAIPAGASVAGYTTDREKLGRGDDASQINVQYVLADFFGVLSVRAARGRLFQGQEQHIEAPTPVLIISDAVWRKRFGARPDIVGQHANVNYRDYTIVGVAPPGFGGPDNGAADVWAPMNMHGSPGDGPTWYTGRGTAWILVLATAGTGGVPALEHGATLMMRASTTFSADSLATARIVPLVDASRGGNDSKQVTIATRLAGVAAIILLIACANVANLFLARGMRRRREIAMRLALGVPRRRLVGLLMLESVIISLLGAVVAVLVAVWGAAALREQVLPEVRWVGPAVDLRVLGFTLILALVTGVLTGLAPALRSSRTDLAETLKGSARDGAFQRSRLRTTLLIAQSALSVVLLAGAGLFIRSLHGIETEDIGYDSDRIVFADVSVEPDHADRAPEISRRLHDLTEPVRRLPGVERTGLTAMVPMRGMSWTKLFRPNGDSMPRVSSEGPFTSYVSPEYFATMGIHLVAGRGLRASDRASDGLAMVVNETMASSYWPGRSAIGECLVLKKPGNPCATVVGVVSNGHFGGIVEKPSMQLYLPLSDTATYWGGLVIAVRTAPGRTAQVVNQLRQRLRPEFSGWAETDIHPMTDDLAGELRPWRAGATLFSAAGLLALLVAIVGIYSTISYTFSQRTHEIGVRMALGARAANVARMVVGAGVRVVLIGVVIGVILSLVAARFVESMLYKTSPRDPAVLIVVSLALLVTAAAACLVPAWRALRVDPATALRAD